MPYMPLRRKKRFSREVSLIAYLKTLKPHINIHLYWLSIARKRNNVYVKMKMPISLGNLTFVYVCLDMSLTRKQAIAK